MHKSNIITSITTKFEIAHQTPDYIFIVESPKNHTTLIPESGYILAYLSLHYNLENRRFFYRDALGAAGEIHHHHGDFNHIFPGNSDDVSLPPIILPLHPPPIQPK